MQLSGIVQEYDFITVKTKLLDQKVSSGVKVFIVEGRNFLDKGTALRELYKVLGFAEYIPHANYDGFDELLSPDMWTDLQEMVLRIINAESLETMHEQDLRKLLAVLASIADDWKASGKTLSLELIS